MTTLTVTNPTLPFGSGITAQQLDLVEHTKLW